MPRQDHFGAVGWYSAAGVLAIAGGIVAAAGVYWVALGLVVLFGLVLAIAQPSTRQATLVASGAILIMSAAAEALPDDATTLSIVLRVAGVAFVGAASIGGARAADPASHTFKDVPNQWQIRFVLPVGAFVWAATLPHGLLPEFVSYGIALILLSCLVFFIGRTPSESLMRGLAVSLGVAVGASLVSAVLSAGSAFEQGRLRGVFENANTLGFFSFALGALAILGVRKPQARAHLFVVAAAALTLTSSRASALALAVVVLIHLISKRPARGLLILFLSLSALAGAVIASPVVRALFESLVRSNNSRDLSQLIAIDAIAENPVWGVGLTSAFAASSFLGAATNAGYVGLALIVVLWIGVLLLSAHIGRRTLIFSIAAMFHSLFEAWLLSPVGPLLLLFSLCWFALAHADLRARVAVTSGFMPADEIVRTLRK